MFIIIAMTDKSRGYQSGISAFIVERTFPGFSVGNHEKKMGIRGSSTCELIMENCIVPKENLLGKRGQGLQHRHDRPWTAAVSASPLRLWVMAEGAIDETVKYTKERKQFGKPISKFQNTQFQLADLAAKHRGRQAGWSTTPP